MLRNQQTFIKFAKSISDLMKFVFIPPYNLGGLDFISEIQFKK